MTLRTILLPMLLIAAIATTPMATSCTVPDYRAAGYYLLAGVVIIGVVILIFAADEQAGLLTPVNPVQLLPSTADGTVTGDFETRTERDWYSVPIVKRGHVVTIWSESREGVMAVVIDENGNYCQSDNGNEPGSNFRIEIHAMEETNLYLMVYGIDEDPFDQRDESRLYTLNWRHEHE